MKRSAVLSSLSKTISDPLDEIASRNHSFHRAFSDFLALSCHALCKQENEYMKVMCEYPNTQALGKREADLFDQAFHAWQDALKTEYKDYLGEIFESKVSFGEKGQFFTPESLCELMAEIMGGQTLRYGERINDPACGSGRTLLAFSYHNRYAVFNGSDIDLNCVRMTALNLLCRNVDATIVWGNPLSLEAWGGYELRRGFLGGEMIWFDAEHAKRALEGPLKDAAKKAEAEAVKAVVDALEKAATEAEYAEADRQQDAKQAEAQSEQVESDRAADEDEEEQMETSF